MNRNITSKRVIKQKITCFFVLCSFLFSQIFYVNVAYAGMPVIDATSLGFNTGNVTINKILEGIAGVAAGAISSLLTKFAKDAGERVVKGLADGDWGNEPLFFDLPFEDYLTSALDNVAGNFLDDINKEYMINLCKPEDISSINWKFKIMLNIKPDLASFETKYEKGPVCKLSDFISATKKTLSNVITSLKESLVGDCFDKFFYNDICPSVSSSVNSDILAVDTTRTALGGIADNVFSSISNSGGSGFSLNGIKDAFGYNGSVNFCKLGTYYIKKDAVLNLKNITSQILAPNSCNYPSKVAEPLESAIWTSNKADCFEYDEYKKPIFSVGNGKINDGGCMYSINYCKFSGDEVILDRVKRSRFVSQYNNCFNPKLAEYLGSMIEVNSALPKEKMIKNQIQKNCKDSLEIISSYSDLKSIFDTALYSTDKDFHVYVAKLLDGFLDKEGDNSTASTLNGSITFKNNKLISARTGNVNNLENRKNILISSFIPVEKVETAENCVEKLNLGVNTLFSVESGKHFLYCPAGNGSISDPVLYYKKGSDFKDLILAKSTNINQLNQDGRINKSSSSENAIIEYCTLLNINRYPFMKIEEDLYNKKIAEEAAGKLADDQKNEEKKVAAEFPPATAIRSIATAIGGQTTTPGELATEETKNSLNAGSNMLQPSDSMFGAVFVDPIKIFITTILNSSSSILMKGLFRVLPKMEEDDIDFQNPGDDISQINNTCIPGDSGFSEGDPCAKNSDCKTCCCNTNYEGGVGDGILYCKPTSWCTSTR